LGVAAGRQDLAADDALAHEQIGRDPTRRAAAHRLPCHRHDHDGRPAPAHPYTAALLAALPEAGMARGALKPIPGQAAMAGEEISGCPFAPRCERATPTSWLSDPPLVAIGPDRSVACVTALALSGRS
jgi:oligopeptide/dipeptide ABC transporter ATP-binding protein